MANMRDIRLRMKSIRQTLQITNAMKLISTSKLRRAKMQLEQTEPYFNKIRETMGDIVRRSQDLQYRYFDKRLAKPERHKAYLVITGDKGLAGGYNHNIIKLTEESCPSDGTGFLLLIGNIGKRYFLRRSYPILESFHFSTSVPTVYEAKEISDYVLEQFDSGAIDEFHIVFTRMYSSVKLVPEVLKVLPLELGDFAPPTGKLAETTIAYIPSPEAVLDSLVPKYLSGVVYGAMVESFASEQSARMTAMDSASKNAQEMLEVLQLTYNRARQTAITQEVTEIVAGAMALNE
jgi:F-type H+-transporting ATPase subunit gamma